MPPSGVPEPVPPYVHEKVYHVSGAYFVLFWHQGSSQEFLPAAGILQMGKGVIYYTDTPLTLEQYLFGKVGICLKKENIFSMEL